MHAVFFELLLIWGVTFRWSVNQLYQEIRKATPRKFLYEKYLGWSKQKLERVVIKKTLYLVLLLAVIGFERHQGRQEKILYMIAKLNSM